MNFDLLSFKRFSYDNDFRPINLEDLNIILGVWNGFQENAAKVVICFFSEIKIFENIAFGHVTEEPNYCIV